MSINREDVNYTANLAKLRYEDEQADKIAESLSQIIKYVDILSEVDTDSVEPMTHVIENTNVFRADEIGETLPLEEVLKNAPDTDERAFRVPKVM